MNELFRAYSTFFGKGDALYRIFSPYRICPLYEEHRVLIRLSPGYPLV